ncbi:hypothetical protein [Jatrophihabitans endophyticus]|uniref:D-alanyl-D-alanine carboxypeptidase family protein n=1 Tax=Jatrophihabitans endophyticus TaxID=1206085 RepID=UPI001A06021C|nr:hypothetical protein [Jatrophihabitans endophyticus]MBE7189869.1 D-alanyl-D-alanine carboxypeptidase [Jatrophihabitans endophyticus]
MTSTLTPPPVHEPARTAPRHRRAGERRRYLLIGVAVLVVSALLAGAAAAVLHRRWDDRDRHYLGAGGWPVDGQAAYSFGGHTVAGPHQAPAPIASLAKVMTAYLVLRAHPLDGGPGFTMHLTAADAAATARREAEQQSVVAVRAGERLTERQALMAVLLPSANNVAALLARRVAGSKTAFVRLMNREASRLGMHDTRYTDPSGFDPRTVSTAYDQTLLAAAVAHDATLTELVGTASYHLPVAGTVHNTDTLLGRRGFVGTKTGSDDAAGGCFMFRTYRVVHLHVRPMVGVVLGQQGHSFVLAGQYAAAQLADRVDPNLPG